MSITVSSDPLKLLERTIPQWRSATWADYLAHRDAKDPERVKLFFDRNSLLITDMGAEGINHARISDLFVTLIVLWFSIKSDRNAETMGRCQLEKQNSQAAAPDLVLYIGADIPQWQKGEPRYLNLDKWRIPDLVGEISDTTLAVDLDEKKQAYATLGIPEYWVIDVLGSRVIAFRLQANGKYQECDRSIALEGLPIELLQQTLQRLEQGTNVSAVTWFTQQIVHLA
jgi:Uma2 family endonuclease